MWKPKRLLIAALLVGLAGLMASHNPYPPGQHPYGWHAPVHHHHHRR
jgi:Spy/CpxP family protein refolding chaperone